MNFAFYVSGNAGRLKKILLNNEAYLKEVKLIVSDDPRNSSLRDMLRNFPNIKYILIDYSGLEPDKNLKLSDKILEYFIEYHIDFCFCFGDHILKGQLLKEFKNRIINFHPSILPMFKGRKAIDQAVKNNSFLLGCTAHFVDPGMDTGPVIMQSVMSKKVFGQSDYDAVLDTQIIMLGKIQELLKSNRIIVNNKDVIIQGADYSRVEFFPHI